MKIEQQPPIKTPPKTEAPIGQEGNLISSEKVRTGIEKERDIERATLLRIEEQIRKLTDTEPTKKERDQQDHYPNQK